jgi:chromosome segregation ATPase
MSSTIAVETVVEEKKEDPHSLIIELKKMENPSNGPPLSPSKRRAKAAGSNGLSELSKQLRIFQAKNEAQAVEINRLERQLRILAELQGILVADLRKALEDACAHKAFGEMQHRVTKLRAELEAAMLAKQNKGRQDAVAPHIANLELRVGELEEVEEKQQGEIHHLYEQLRHERARATRLESESDQYKKDLQDYLDRFNQESARGAKLEATFQEQLQKMHEEQALKMQQLAKQQAACSARQYSFQIDCLLHLTRNGCRL